MTKISSHHTKNSSRSARCRYAFSLTLFLLASFLPLLAAAATAPKNSPLSLEDARWFQVELILFAQIKGEPLEAEQWPELAGLTLPSPLLELHLPPVEVAPDALPENETTADLPTEPTSMDVADPEPPVEDTIELPPAYEILGEDALQLTSTVEKLRRSSRFRPLLHIAWQQPTYDRQQAEPIFFMEGMNDPLPIEADEEALLTDDTENPDQLQPAADVPLPAEASQLPALLEYATEEDTKIGPPNPQFAGTVTLSVERYLHFATDLAYRQPVTQRSPILIPDLELWYDRPHPTLQEPQGPAYRLESWQALRGFRLKESRRMRSKEIHYLDHPFMGVVVVITPVELPEPAEEIQQTSPQNILSAPSRPRPAP